MYPQQSGQYQHNHSSYVQSQHYLTTHLDPSLTHCRFIEGMPYGAMQGYYPVVPHGQTIHAGNMHLGSARNANVPISTQPPPPANRRHYQAAAEYYESATAAVDFEPVGWRGGGGRRPFVPRNQTRGWRSKKGGGRPEPKGDQLDDSTKSATDRRTSIRSPDVSGSGADMTGKKDSGKETRDSRNLSDRSFNRMTDQGSDRPSDSAILQAGNLWSKYPDIQSMMVQTDKSAVIEILESFASAHKKQTFLFQRLKATILRTMSEYSAKDLASICHSFVVLGFLHEDFVLAMAPRLIATAHLCTAGELTRLLDAYASLRCNAPEPFRVMTAETLRRLSEFSISDLMTHASSFARLNLHNQKLFSMIAERVLAIEAEMCSAAATGTNAAGVGAAVMKTGTGSSRMSAVGIAATSADATSRAPVEDDTTRSPRCDYLGHETPPIRTKNRRACSPVASTAAATCRSPDDDDGPSGAAKNRQSSPMGAHPNESSAAEAHQSPAATAPTASPSPSTAASQCVSGSRPLSSPLSPPSALQPASGSLFSARDLTLAAYSFAKLGFHIPELFRFVSRHAKAVIRDFTAHQIQMVAVAFHRANVRDVELFHEMSIQAQRRIAQFNAESVALLLRSYSLFDIRDESLFTRVVAQLPRLILTFRPLDVATTLNAFARLGVASPALLAIVVPHILEEGSKFGASDLQSVLHACAKLGSVNAEFLELFCRSCDLSQLSPVQLTLVASDLPKLGCRDLAFLGQLQNALRVRANYLSATTMAQIQAAFLFLELHHLEQFQPFMRSMASHIRAQWYPCVADTASAQPSARRQRQLIMHSGALASLCLAEIATMAATDFEASMPEDSLWEYFPIHPTELLYRLLAQQQSVASADKSKAGESVSGGSFTEVVEIVNLIRAATSVLPGFPESIQPALDFFKSRRCSTACLYGNKAGCAEKDTEFALQEVAMLLRAFSSASGIVFYLPTEDAMDEVHFYSTAPQLPSSTSKQSDSHASSSTKAPDPDTSTSPNGTRHLAVGSRSNKHDERTEKSRDGLSDVDITDNSSSRRSVPCIRVGDLDYDIDDQQVFRNLPYHSFLAVQEPDLHGLRRYVPMGLPAWAGPSGEAGLGCVRSNAPDAVGLRVPDGTPGLQSSHRRETRGLPETRGMGGGRGFPDIRPISDDSDSLNSTAFGRARARSQSDSMIIRTCCSSEDEEILRNDYPEDQEGELNEQTCSMDDGYPSPFSSLRISELRGKREHRAVSDMSGPHVGHPPGTKGPLKFILWGSSLHYWHTLDELKPKPLGGSPDDMDDEFDDEDELVTDEVIQSVVVAALRESKNACQRLTPMARLQLLMFMRLVPEDAQVFLLPHFVWNSLSSPKLRIPFLAALLLNSGNSVEYSDLKASSTSINCESYPAANQSNQVADERAAWHSEY